MTQYIALVETTIHREGHDELTRSRRLFTEAKNVQFVKEQYHRHLHENYKIPSRAREDEHTHKIHQTNITISLEDVKRLDETWLGHSEIDARLSRV